MEWLDDWVGWGGDGAGMGLGLELEFHPNWALA